MSWFETDEPGDAGGGDDWDDEPRTGRWPLHPEGLYPRERWLWFEQLWSDACALWTRYGLPLRSGWWEDQVQVESLAALAAWVEHYDSGEWDDPPGKLALLYDLERVAQILRVGGEPFHPDRDRLAFARYLIDLGCQPPPNEPKQSAHTGGEGTGGVTLGGPRGGGRPPPLGSRRPERAVRATRYNPRLGYLLNGDGASTSDSFFGSWPPHLSAGAARASYRLALCQPSARSGSSGSCTRSPLRSCAPSSRCRAQRSCAPAVGHGHSAIRYYFV